MHPQPTTKTVILSGAQRAESKDPRIFSLGTAARRLSGYPSESDRSQPPIPHSNFALD